MLMKFFVQKFVQSQTLSRKKLLIRILYEKCTNKMLMKLTVTLLIYVDTSSIISVKRNTAHGSKSVCVRACVCVCVFVYVCVLVCK